MSDDSLTLVPDRRTDREERRRQWLHVRAILRPHRGRVTLMAGASFAAGLVETALLVVVTRVALAIADGDNSFGVLAGRNMSVGLALTFAGLLVVVRLALALLASLVGIGSGISQPLTLVIIAEHVQAPQRPSALAVRLMGNRAAQVLAPLILGMLAEVLGFTWTFMIAGFSLLAVIFVIVRLTPAFKRVEADNQLKQ